MCETSLADYGHVGNTMIPALLVGLDLLLGTSTERWVSVLVGYGWPNLTLTCQIRVPDRQTTQPSPLCLFFGGGGIRKKYLLLTSMIFLSSSVLIFYILYFFSISCCIVLFVTGFCLCSSCLF